MAHKALENSEVFWWQYKKVLHDVHGDGQPYKKAKKESLAHIVRSVIINGITLDTMRWCQGEEMDEKGWFVVRPSQPSELDDFCALLGTPNGTAAAYLLIQHGISFEKKQIDRIEYSFAEAEMRIHFS